MWWLSISGCRADACGGGGRALDGCGMRSWGAAALAARVLVGPSGRGLMRQRGMRGVASGALRGARSRGLVPECRFARSGASPGGPIRVGWELGPGPRGLTHAERGAAIRGPVSRRRPVRACRRGRGSGKGGGWRISGQKGYDLRVRTRKQGQIGPKRPRFTRNRWPSVRKPWPFWPERVGLPCVSTGLR